MIERISQNFFLPTVLFGFAFFAAQYESKLPADARVIAQYLPYFGLILVLLIASFFNRGRTFIASGLALGVLALEYFTAEYPHLGSAALILIPLNIALLAIIPERGTFTVSGFFRIGVVGAQLAGLIYGLTHLNEWMTAWLTFSLLPVWSELLAESQIAAFFAFTTLFCSFAASYVKGSPINQSLLAANIGIVAILIVDLPSATDNAFMFTVALMLAIGLFRDYYNMAYRDELTSLPQRRALNENMTTLGSRYCIAMLDVDHFKKFNDTHGHDVGDQVLQMVASQIQKVQGGGKAYRYGGEEFTVLFSSGSLDDAAYFLDVVRQNIEDYEMVLREQERPEIEDKGQKKSRTKGSFRSANKTVSVTISIGVAERARGEQPEDVLKRADEVLYKAKKAGRNRVSKQ